MEPSPPLREWEPKDEVEEPVATEEEKTEQTLWGLNLLGFTFGLVFQESLDDLDCCGSPPRVWFPRSPRHPPHRSRGFTLPVTRVRSGKRHHSPGLCVVPGYRWPPSDQSVQIATNYHLPTSHRNMTQICSKYLTFVPNGFYRG